MHIQTRRFTLSNAYQAQTTKIKPLKYIKYIMSVQYLCLSHNMYLYQLEVSASVDNSSESSTLPVAPPGFSTIIFHSVLSPTLSISYSTFVVFIHLNILFNFLVEIPYCNATTNYCVRVRAKSTLCQDFTLEGLRGVSPLIK